MKLFFLFIIGFLLLCATAHAQFDEPSLKCLTASGAVTTNNKAGILQKFTVSGSNAGDQCIIKDGTTTRFTITVPAANDTVVWDTPEGTNVIFYTDIDCILSASGNMFVTFLYREQS